MIARLLARVRARLRPPEPAPAPEPRPSQVSAHGVQVSTRAVPRVQLGCTSDSRAVGREEA